jgi:hypothetical protein
MELMKSRKASLRIADIRANRDLTDMKKGA